MRVNHCSPQLTSREPSVLQKDEKTKIVAKDVLASLPTIGLEPISIGVVCTACGVALGWIATKFIGGTGERVIDRASQDLADYLYPLKETNPFNLKACVESYHHGTKPDIRVDKLRPNPIYQTKIAEAIEHLRNAPKNALVSGSKLPYAIISGPFGTGKTTSLEGIARAGDWNYFLFTGEQFSKLLQNEDASNRFFQDVRKEKLPTVFVIDEANSLFKSSEENDKALQRFRALTSNKDHKLMFLFATSTPLKEIEISDPAFINRMNFQITVGMPSREELKEIIFQQANRLFTTAFKSSFTLEACDYLANTVFKGKNGRDVESALMALNPNSPPLSKNQLHEHIQRYFNEHRI